MNKPRVAAAGVFHESNTFADGRTKLDAFRSAWYEGDELFSTFRGTQTVMGGFISGAASEQLELVPVFHCSATPSGPVERTAFDEIIGALAAALERAGPMDGILLELHGAMVVEGLDSGDGAIAAAVRQIVGDVPIVAVLDPHANIFPTLLEDVDCLLAYRTNPHVDMAEHGYKAASLLMRIVRDRVRPVTSATRVPVIAAAVAQATADEPLKTLVAELRRTDTHPKVLSNSIFFGFAYADVPHLGMTVVSITNGEPTAAGQTVKKLARRTWEERGKFARTLAAPAAAVEAAASARGLVVLADTGDNVGGGAPGNSTVLAATVVADGRVRTATTICDPAAVEQARAAGAGACVTLSLGHPPLELTADVIDLRDGHFVNDGPLAAGVPFDMGPVALLQAGPLVVVAQTRAVMANDQNMFRSVGVDLDKLDAVILKGAAAVRAGWRSRAVSFVDVDTPGPTTSNVSSLPFRRASRPLWPLDSFGFEV